MDSHMEKQEYELMVVIVNFGLGSKILHVAKKHGIQGGTIFLGKGTVKNRLLEFLDLCDIRKEILLMVAEKQTVRQALAILSEKFHFQKPNHGIAFSSPIAGLFGVRSCPGGDDLKSGGIEKQMYHSIFVIVDRGSADDVMEAATKAGSRGGTIIHGRGSGIHETSKVFSMEIEPEKEIVLILAEDTRTPAIVSSIREAMQIDQPGKGIIFVQEVSQTYGLY